MNNRKNNTRVLSVKTHLVRSSKLNGVNVPLLGAKRRHALILQLLQHGSTSASRSPEPAVVRCCWPRAALVLTVVGIKRHVI